MLTICKQCSKEFNVRPSVIKRGEGKFCSKKCFDISQSGMIKKTKNPNDNCDTGKKYGRLTITGFSHMNKWYVKFVFVKCDCGIEKIMPLGQIRGGSTVSCGCFHKETAKETLKEAVTTHGKSKTQEYKIWKSIRQRCNNINCPEYPYYGGRGIKMCDRWNSFDNFYEDMGVRPSLYHSIDRFPDVDGNYEANNCRWATSFEQNRNRRSNIFINFNGNKMIAKDFAILVDKGYQGVLKYIKRHTEEETLIHFLNK